MDPKALAGLVQPKKLKARGFPAPTQVLLTFGTDHTGEDAYRVYLVFPDDTPDDALSWTRMKPMVRWVQSKIWEADGERHWPYVRVKRKSELSGEWSDVESES